MQKNLKIYGFVLVVIRLQVVIERSFVSLCIKYKKIQKKIFKIILQIIRNISKGLEYVRNKEIFFYLRNNSSRESETDSELDDVWQQYLEELGDKFNVENDRIGFFRMVNRNYKLNSSNYSLSSMFSLFISFIINSFNMYRKFSLRMKFQVLIRVFFFVLY